MHCILRLHHRFSCSAWENQSWQTGPPPPSTHSPTHPESDFWTSARCPLRALRHCRFSEAQIHKILACPSSNSGSHSVRLDVFHVLVHTNTSLSHIKGAVLWNQKHCLELEENDIVKLHNYDVLSIHNARSKCGTILLSLAACFFFFKEWPCMQAVLKAVLKSDPQRSECCLWGLL